LHRPRQTRDDGDMTTTRLLATLILVLLSAFAVCANAQSPYAEDGPVVELTDENFADLVMENGRDVWVVAFHADGCAPCAQMAPTFTKAAKSMDGIVKFGHVHVSEATMAIARGVGIVSVPAVLGFPAHKTINPYKKNEASKQHETYKNSTSSHKRVAEFAASLLPPAEETIARVETSDDLARVKEANANDASPPLPIATLASTKDVTSTLYRSLALKFKHRVVFTEAHAGSEVVAGLGVDPEDAPVLMISKPGEDAIVRHDGEMKATEIAEFLETHAAAVPEDDAPEERDPRAGSRKTSGGGGGDDDDAAAKKKREEAKRKRETESLFGAIAPADFEKEVLKHEPVTAVVFTRLNVPRCVNESRAVAKAVTKMYGQVTIGEVNASDPAAFDLAERYAPAVAEAVKAAAAAEDEDEDGKCLDVVVFPHGAEKEDSDPDTYQGEITESALGNWLFESVPDFVMPLKAMLVDSFLQQNLMKPKLVLFHAGSEPPREFVALAANFQEDFMFASIPASDAASKARFQVDAVPAMRLMYIPMKDGETPTQDVQYSAAAYPSPVLRYVEMHHWLQQVQIQILGKDIGQERAAKKTAEPVELVGSPEELDEKCGASGLCIVAFVSQEEGVKKDTDEAVIAAVSRNMVEKPFKFVYVDPAAQRSFASAFEVTASDVPTVTVVSMRKNRFATYRKTFNADGVAEFLQDVLNSKQRTQMIQEIPKLVPGGEEPEVIEEVIVEEEFDLADIMNEEVEGEAGMSKEELQAKIEKEIEEEAAAAKEAEEEAKRKAEKKAKKKKKKKKTKKDASEL
jgi:thiol-disulfide isomerase/thioredoxin